jgi:hypothetical protein
LHTFSLSKSIITISGRAQSAALTSNNNFYCHSERSRGI